MESDINKMRELGYTQDEVDRATLRNMIHEEVKSDDPEAERARLTAIYGKVWDTAQLQEEFVALGFAAPYVRVFKKDTGQEGTLLFQHKPRFYFEFDPV